MCHMVPYAAVGFGGHCGTRGRNPAMLFGARIVQEDYALFAF